MNTSDEDPTEKSFFWQMTWTVGVTLFIACLPTLIVLFAYKR